MVQFFWLKEHQHKYYKIIHGKKPIHPLWKMRWPHRIADTLMTVMPLIPTPVTPNRMIAIKAYTKLNIHMYIYHSYGRFRHSFWRKSLVWVNRPSPRRKYWIINIESSILIKILASVMNFHTPKLSPTHHSNNNSWGEGSLHHKLKWNNFRSIKKQ